MDGAVEQPAHTNDKTLTGHVEKIFVFQFSVCHVEVGDTDENMFLDCSSDKINYILAINQISIVPVLVCDVEGNEKVSSAKCVVQTPLPRSVVHKL